MSETKVIDINELKFDQHNFNQHNEQGMELLGKSIKEVGFGRSIFLDKDNNIVGGNGVTEKALQLGTKKVRIIDTDGTELIAVRRTDLSLDSEKGRKAALADNSVGYQNLTWKEDELRAAQEQWGIVPEEWGVELPDSLDIDSFFDENAQGKEKQKDVVIEIVCPADYTNEDTDRIKGIIEPLLKEFDGVKVK